jgi:putative endonuclease
MGGFAYILLCDDGHRYYGSTNNLIERLKRHRGAQVRSTKWRLPIRLVYFEQFETLDQARQRERAFKNGRTRRKTIDQLIANCPQAKLAPFA